MPVKKLIEVALPLEAINAESAREKSIRHGHPSTLHLWWARRPLATARAVIWASLVDDPSSHPELFPTEAAQQAERERLFRILTELVKWENSNNEAVLSIARAEIRKCTNGIPNVFLDPFAGGGAIPLEAQRLGLESHAHDLNPVAVMINKAMIEIPPKFSGIDPINPESRRSLANMATHKGTSGLVADLRYYGRWMREEASNRIGHLYPHVQTSDSKSGTAIAWIWARTVKCPNPACECEMPLVRSFTLTKKKGNEKYIEAKCVDGKFQYTVRTGKHTEWGTVDRKGGICPACHMGVELSYIRQAGREGKMGADLMAVVAEGRKGREYLSPDSEQIQAANVPKPDVYPDAWQPQNPRDFKTPNYGLASYSDLFTNRQLTLMTTLASLISDVQQKAINDALAAGMQNDGIALSEGGQEARAYGEAIGVYLAFLIDKLADYHTSICSWHNSKELIRNTFGRQAIPMTWDYAEANPFSSSAGCFDNMLEWITKCVEQLPANNMGYAKQFDAQSDNGMRNIIVSTDPPYYDNISYADLSDFFYIWMRHALRNTYPHVFRTMLVPKEEELVASPYRFDGGTEAAKSFFEEGMYHTCCQLSKYTCDDIPVTIYYAFKQSENDSEDETASTGWETMLSAIIQAGFAITGTWPMRTEMANRTIASGANALASSIVLVCRKRSNDARSVTRREFINALHREMRPALTKLQSANIAPVDLAQSAIGPGIGVFSRYKSVLESDGKPMSVRSALQIINQELDAFYNEQEGTLDRESRFCVELFSQYAFNQLKFGDADILARAKNTSVQALADRGVLTAAKGNVALKTREELPTNISSMEECIWLLTQQLAYLMEKEGIAGCAKAIVGMHGSNVEDAKALAYRLYTICERKNWAQEGYAYNNLVVAWPDIQAQAAQLAAATPTQMSLDDILKGV